MRILGLTFGGLVVLCIGGGLVALYVVGRDDPSQYEERVAAQEAEYGGAYPTGGVLLSGSSFFEYWETSASDLAPLDTINIGIGGTKAGDHIAYFDRMVLPFEPRVLVLYIGSNDISGIPLYTKSAEDTVALIESYIENAREALPQTKIYYVAITEAPARSNVREEIQEANRQLAQLAEDSGDFIFIDTAPSLLRPDGSIDGSLFGPDRLHFNDSGYRAFAAAVRAGLRAEYPAGSE
jgi:lysophospholipase L1-like esterase